MKIRPLLFAMLFVSTPLFAQSRVFVSGTGNDGNACTIASPRRSFSRAVAAVAAGGEIIPLDSAGYGTFTIDKSLSISAPQGVYAGVTASGVGNSAIAITTPSVSVSLIGLSINGTDAAYGIAAGADGVRLHVERLTLTHFALQGINFGSTGGQLFVANSTLRDGGGNDIWVNSIDPGNHAVATIDHVLASGAITAAIYAGPNADVTVRDSVAFQNFRGFEVAEGGAGMTIEHCAATDNGDGVFATTAGDIIYVSNSVISHNTVFGIEAQVGTSILSRGNNTVIANAAGELFSGTFPAK